MGDIDLAWYVRSVPGPCISKRSNWEYLLATPAPRVIRMAISRSRTVVRASMRLATLAQAIKSSSPTIAGRIVSAGFAAPTRRS